MFPLWPYCCVTQVSGLGLIIQPLTMRCNVIIKYNESEETIITGPSWRRLLYCSLEEKPVMVWFLVFDSFHLCHRAFLRNPLRGLDWCVVWHHFLSLLPAVPPSFPPSLPRSFLLPPSRHTACPAGSGKWLRKTVSNTFQVSPWWHRKVGGHGVDKRRVWRWRVETGEEVNTWVSVYWCVCI